MKFTEGSVAFVLVWLMKVEIEIEWLIVVILPVGVLFKY